MKHPQDNQNPNSNSNPNSTIFFDVHYFYMILAQFYSLSSFLQQKKVWQNAKYIYLIFERKNGCRILRCRRARWRCCWTCSSRRSRCRRRRRPASAEDWKKNWDSQTCYDLLVVIIWPEIVFLNFPCHNSGTLTLKFIQRSWDKMNRNKYIANRPALFHESTIKFENWKLERAFHKHL